MPHPEVGSRGLEIMEERPKAVAVLILLGRGRKWEGEERRGGGGQEAAGQPFLLRSLQQSSMK
jgi:hypothetical protein